MALVNSIFKYNISLFVYKLLVTKCLMSLF